LPADQAAFGGSDAGKSDPIDPRRWLCKHFIRVIFDSIWQFKSV